ncbi:arylsulfatase B-like isoform X2 [Haemaphysalis longicornis]
MPVRTIYLVYALLGAVNSAAAGKYYAKPPHIVFVLADDLGRADVSTYGSPQIPTPNMDALARAGVVLNNYYAQPMCTPSRASLMTGLYAIHTGLQHLTLMPGEPSGLPLHLKILPEHLRDLGYETHCVGKWGIGYASLDSTPTYRGFDSFYGMYSGPVDYYSHYIEWKGHRGLDLWHNTEPLKNETGQYLTTLFQERAEHIIANRNKTKPLFLFLAHQAPHKTFGIPPMQAPKKNVEKFLYIGKEQRMLHAGMVDALDQSIGSLMEALEAASMLEDTVLVFSSDNGATLFSLGGNWPLRGLKGSLWEGAIRAAGFVWSPRLENRGRVSQQLMHISDWLPTLYSSAGQLPDLKCCLRRRERRTSPPGTVSQLAPCSRF